MTEHTDPPSADEQSIPSSVDPDASPNRADSGTDDVDITQLLEEIQREHDQFEAFLAGIVVGGEIYDEGVPEEDFNAYVRREWREYLHEE